MKDVTTTNVGTQDALGAKTQRSRILRLLIDARGQWVPLPQILELRISQFGARILELRRAGFNIENRTEQINGIRHSWYRLVSSPASPNPQPPAPSKLAPAKPASGSLDWYERTAGQPRPSDKPKAKEDFGPLFEVRP